MLLMGTRAAAVPAAAISVKVPISLYLICRVSFSVVHGASEEGL